MDLTPFLYRRLAATVLSSITLLAPMRVSAWGCEGHQTVALIASQQLTATARARVDKLLRDHPIDPQLSRFCNPHGLSRIADAATWADDVRNTPKYATTAGWHFLDIPRGAARTRVPGLCPPDGCVTKAIVDQVAILKGHAKGKKKADALRFLIHFVGDVHQPLHCTTNSDRGGNCVPVTFFGLNPTVSNSGKATPNLHAIWDTGMIGKDPANTSLAAYVQTLSQQFQPQMAGWRAAGINPEDWAWESHLLAESTAYGKLPTVIPIEPERGELMSCVVGSDNISKRMALFKQKIGQPYQNDAQPVIEEQLAKAGTRLALELNQIWP